VFQPSSNYITHQFLAASLRRIREKGGTTTRKLIGHSGPVYSLSFDPLRGSAAPPKYLLSASADATTRLWSLDTMTNVVAYRGHQNPVWDVEWSPMGVYFATGSRDRTARLWSTDRSSALRVYAGHLSDVDVGLLRLLHYPDADNGFIGSVLSSIQTRCILPQDLATGLRDYGMFSEAPVFAFSLDIKELFPLLLSAQTAGI
jgi:WD40 repeat protein